MKRLRREVEGDESEKETKDDEGEKIKRIVTHSFSLLNFMFNAKATYAKYVWQMYLELCLEQFL